MELEAFGLRVSLFPVPVISPIIPNVRYHKSMRRKENGTFLLEIILFSILAVSFGPFFIAGMEFLLFKSSKFEGWLRDVGIHSFYNNMYEPIINFVRDLF